MNSMEVSEMLTQQLDQQIECEEHHGMITATTTSNAFPDYLIYRATMLSYGKIVPLQELHQLKVGPFAITISTEDWRQVLVVYAQAFSAASAAIHHAPRPMGARDIAQAIHAALRLGAHERFNSEIFSKSFLMESRAKGLVHEAVGEKEKYLAANKL